MSCLKRKGKLKDYISDKIELKYNTNDIHL